MPRCHVFASTAKPPTQPVGRSCGGMGLKAVSTRRRPVEGLGLMKIVAPRQARPALFVCIQFSTAYLPARSVRLFRRSSVLTSALTRRLRKSRCKSDTCLRQRRSRARSCRVPPKLCPALVRGLRGVRRCAPCLRSGRPQSVLGAVGGGAMTSRTVHPAGATIGGGVRAHHGSMVRRVTQGAVLLWTGASHCLGHLSGHHLRCWRTSLDCWLRCGCRRGALGGPHLRGRRSRRWGHHRSPFRRLRGGPAARRRGAAAPRAGPERGQFGEESGQLRSHCCQSWSRRIRSASRIASASSSTAAGVSCVSVVMSLTSFSDHRGRGPVGVRR